MDNPVGAPNSNSPKGNSIDGFARPSRPMPHSSPAGQTPTDSATTVKPATAPPPSQEILPTDKVEQLMPENAFSNKPEKTSKLWTIILVVLIVVIFVGGIFGVYKYQQNKINSANAKVKTLTVENQALKNKTMTNGTSATTTGSTTLTIYNIPELGVSLKLPVVLVDLTFVENSAKIGVNLSSQTLAAADPACTASATVAPLGTLEKVNGQFPKTASSTTTLVKQYPTYYIAYTTPASNCSTSTQVNALANSLINSLKSSFASIEVITS